MAIRIPVLEQAVDQAPLDTPRLAPAPDANDFGLGMIQQIGAGATDLSRAVVAQQSKLLEGDLLRADAELGDATGKFLIDTTTGEKAWRGRVAVGRHQDWLKAFDETAGRIKKGLSGRAKSAFDEIAARRRAGYTSTVQRYIAGENEAAYRQAVDSSINTASNDFVMAARTKITETLDEKQRYYGQVPRQVLDTKGMMSAMADGLAKVRLAGGDKAQETAFVSGAVQNAVGGLLASGDINTAEDVFRRYGDAVSPEVRAKLEPIIGAAVRSSSIAASADSVFRAAVDRYGESDPKRYGEIIAQLDVPADQRAEVLERANAIKKQADWTLRESEAPIIDQIELGFRPHGGQPGRRPQKNKDGLVVLGNTTLSRSGSLTVQKRWESWVNEVNGRANQNSAADELALSQYNALPLTGVPGEDRTSVQLNNPLFDGASEKGRNRIKRLIEDTRRSVQKDNGVGSQEFDDRIERIFPKPRNAKNAEAMAAYSRIQARARDWRYAWEKDPKNDGRRDPTSAEIEPLLTELGELWIQDTLWLSRDKVLPRGAIAPDEIGDYRPLSLSAPAPEQIAPDAVVFSPTAPKPGKVRVTDGNSIGTVDADKVEAFIEKQRRETGTEWRQL